MSLTYIPKRLKQQVGERATFCCEYCLIAEGDGLIRHEIDHIIAEQHGGSTILENLAYSCINCNRAKGPNLSSYDHGSGEIVRLFNPRTDAWDDHFEFAQFEVHSKSQIGHVTVQLLKLNAPERVLERERLG